MKINRQISPILTIKLVAMATPLEPSEKDGQVANPGSNSYGENLANIGLVDTEIALLKGSLKIN